MLDWLKKAFLKLLSIFGIHSKQGRATNLGNTSEASNEAATQSNLKSSHPIGVRFYPTLVDNLKTDHQHLLQLYTEINDTVNAHDYRELPAKLEKFQNDLLAHLEAENIKFYGYLEQSLKADSRGLQEMRRFRKEMRDIERAVVKFLKSWITTGINVDNVEAFKAEYDAIGAALVSRIESEERSLYTLYAEA